MPADDGDATPGTTDRSAGPAALPADKDELIRSMTRALRVAFKMASMYNAEHPAFKSSVNELLAKLEALFVYVNPLSIGFSPHALLIDGRFWEGERTYMDLAQLFHFRKIKRLEIRPGVPQAEFMRFASKIMLPVKLFIKEGGAQAIVKREAIVHIAVDTLDYSILLQGEGEEIKDIWPYLLMEAVEEDDHAKLEQLAGIVRQGRRQVQHRGPHPERGAAQELHQVLPLSQDDLRGEAPDLPPSSSSSPSSRPARRRRSRSSRTSSSSSPT